MKIRQGFDNVWQWLNKDRRLLDIFIVFLVIQILAFIIPQAPVPRSDGPGYTRWLAEMHPRLGKWASIFSGVGILTLRTSLWMRGVLVMLVLVIVARSASLRERWTEFTPSQKWRHMALCVGGLLIVAGWSAQIVWGWKQPEITAWPDSPVVVAERGLTLPPHDGRLRLWRGRYGLYLVPKGSSVGLEVQATGEDGSLLALLSSARSDPQTQLRIALTQETPEAYFALPDAGLVFRVSQVPDNGTHVQAQVYRSASGELLAETVLEGSGSLFANDIRLKLDHYVLPRFEAVYNPGAVFEGLGLLMLAVIIVLYHRTLRVIQDVGAPADEEAAQNNGKE